MMQCMPGALTLQRYMVMLHYFIEFLMGTYCYTLSKALKRAAQAWKARGMMRAPVAAAQPAPAAGFLASAAAASSPAALASACRSERCDFLRVRLTGAERRPWLLPLSDPARQRRALLALLLSFSVTHALT